MQKLRGQRQAVTSPAFIEQEARDRLNMCFPSQTCYVVITPAKRHAKTTPGPAVDAVVRGAVGVGAERGRDAAEVAPVTMR